MSEPRFVATAVLKRDAFSETFLGHAEGAPDVKLVLRRLSGLPWWSRGIARALARREVRGLRAVAGIEGVPELVRFDREGVLRIWTAGTPLNLARPGGPEFYADARRLLRALRARGVTHNDLAKPQNWLLTGAGGAAVIDFQLVRVHRRRGWLWQAMAYEDLRHLQKQRWRYARHAMGPRARRLVAERSGPGRLWRRTGKRLYRAVTRRVFHWSDGEGTAQAVVRRAPEVRARLMAGPGIRELVVCPVPLPGRGVGLYGFAETELSARTLQGRRGAGDLSHLQPVAELPRTGGAVRRDVLELIAMNRLDELELLLEREPGLRAVVEPIRDGRLNFSDRVLRGREAG